MAIKSKKPMLPWYSKALYGAGSLSFGVMQHTVSGLIMFFGIAAQNMSGSLMGLICAVAMLSAAVMDPIAGNVSDRTQNKLLGKRLGYIILGVFVIALLNIAVWSLPAAFPQWLKFIWLFIGVAGMEVFNSFVQVPYNKLGVELAGSAFERDIISKYRYVFVMLGLIVPVGLMGIFISDSSNILEYRNMACISSILIILCGMGVFFGAYSHMPRLNAKAVQSPKPVRKTIKDIFKEFVTVMKDGQSRSFLLGYATGFMSIAFLTTIGLFFFRYTAGFELRLVAALIGIVFAFVLAGDPFWRKLSGKYEKRSLLLAAMIFMLLGTVLILLVFVFDYYLNLFPTGKFGMFVPGMVFIGIGSGGIFTLPRVIAEKLFKNRDGGVKIDGAQLMTFSYKLAASAIAFIVGILLDSVRFSAKDAAAGTMPGYAYAALGWILVSGLLASTLASFILYCRYDKPGKEKQQANAAGQEAT